MLVSEFRAQSVVRGLLRGHVLQHSGGKCTNPAVWGCRGLPCSKILRCNCWYACLGTFLCMDATCREVARLLKSVVVVVVAVMVAVVVALGEGGRGGGHRGFLAVLSPPVMPCKCLPGHA